MLDVAMKLADVDELAKRHSDLDGKARNYTSVRAYHYPPLPCGKEDDPVCLGRHSDCGSLSIIFQSKNGGLQIESPDKEFVNVVQEKRDISVHCW